MGVGRESQMTRLFCEKFYRPCANTRNDKYMKFRRYVLPTPVSLLVQVAKGRSLMIKHFGYTYANT